MDDEAHAGHGLLFLLHFYKSGCIRPGSYILSNPLPPADHFSENAYGIYIFHYGFVIWVQFVLLAQPLPAAVKFLITFSVALVASWFLTALLRRTVARRVL